MNKMLLASSALVAGVSLINTASANETQIEWSAYTDFNVSSTGVEGNVEGGDTNNGLDFNTNSEIHLNASQTADNGLTYGLHIQLEADQNSTNNTDENHIFIQGDFGKVELGDQDSAGDRMMISGSSVGFQYGMLGNYTGGLSALENEGTLGRTASDFSDSSDATKITYFTPTFNGFKAGVSFAPDGDSGQTASADSTSLENHFDGALNYSGSFNDVSIDAALIGGTHEVPGSGSSDNTYYAVGGGLMVGYAGFKAAVGAIHEDTEDTNEIDTVDVGFSYGTGPWSLAVGAAWSEFDGDNGVNNESIAYSAGVGYEIAPGLSTWAGATVGEYEGGVEDFTNFQTGISVAF
ncbi:porin [Kiloniella antarctica]|uniref:Porin n=1 Tax=Kiloniella antarctica TaxID=1550907 RepID=A0ABW5BPJ4_9PROT